MRSKPVSRNANHEDWTSKTGNLVRPQSQKAKDRKEEIRGLDERKEGQDEDEESEQADESESRASDEGLDKEASEVDSIATDATLDRRSPEQKKRDRDMRDTRDKTEAEEEEGGEKGEATAQHGLSQEGATEEGEEGRVSKGLTATVKVSRKEREEHERTHTPFRSWCKYCVRGRATNAQHRKKKEEEEEEEEENESSPD